jgi:sugar transferase (PEP-CTERM system associated)
MLRIFGHFVPTDKLVLVAAEMLLIGTAAFGLLVFDGLTASNRGLIQTLINVPSVFSLLAVLAMVAVGLYSYDAVFNLRATVSRTILALILVVPVFIVAGLLLRHFIDIFNIRLIWYAEATLAWFVCVILSRMVHGYLLGHAAFKRRVVVIGTGNQAARIRRDAELNFGCHFVPVAFVPSPHEGPRQADAKLKIAPGGCVDELEKFVWEQRAKEVVVATDDRRGLPVEQLLRCKVAGIGVIDYLSFYERENGRIDLEALQPSWLIFSDGFRTGWIVKTIKRSFDIVVSLGFLIFTLPILLATALLIALERGGSILYRQERVGQYGKTFTLLKFRSMRADAECAGDPQWAAKQDPRVTAIGALIRKVRIDELPQLINVLKGEMSFIGPRPERPFFVKQLSESIRFYGERHAVKPGISGWAQINYPYAASLDDARKKLEYDLYYVKNCTLFLDFLILVRTVRVILFPEGAR